MHFHLTFLSRGKRVTRITIRRGVFRHSDGRRYYLRSTSCYIFQARQISVRRKRECSGVIDRPFVKRTQFICRGFFERFRLPYGGESSSEKIPPATKDDGI